MRLEAGELRLSVADDGVGFGNTGAGGRRADGKGSGLANMRSRVEQLGGKFECVSNNSKGIRVTVSVPLRPMGRRAEL